MAKAENKYIRTTNGNTMDYLYENARLDLHEMIHVTPEWSEVTADQAQGACGNHPSIIEVREDEDAAHEDSSEEEDSAHEDFPVEDVTVSETPPKRGRRNRG